MENALFGGHAHKPLISETVHTNGPVSGPDEKPRQRTSVTRHYGEKTPNQHLTLG